MVLSFKDKKQIKQIISSVNEMQKYANLSLQYMDEWGNNLKDQEEVEINPFLIEKKVMTVEEFKKILLNSDYAKIVTILNCLLLTIKNALYFKREYYIINYINRIQNRNLLKLYLDIVLLHEEKIKLFFEIIYMTINALEQNGLDNDDFKMKFNVMKRKILKTHIKISKINKQINDLKSGNINDMSFNIVFSDMWEHFRYLQKQGKYIINPSANFIYVKSIGDLNLPHLIIFKEHDSTKKKNMYCSTLLYEAKMIFKNGFIEVNKKLDTLDFGKVLFTNVFQLTERYDEDQYIILQCDLSNYEVYSFRDQPASFVWGKVEVDAITNIYLCQGQGIKKISKEELFDLPIEMLS